MNFLNIFYSFVIYSFFGWLVETIFVSLKRKQFVNMGFLDGPLSPIYGFGALTLIFLVFPFRFNILLFFIISIILTSIIEYITSLFFEKTFHIVWWNYSKEPFNINGRVCLKNSLYWGLLSIITLLFIHPSIRPLIYFLSKNLNVFGIFLFIIFFLIDATDTFKNLLKLRKNHSIRNPKLLRLFKAFPNFTIKIR